MYVCIFQMKMRVHFCSHHDVCFPLLSSSTFLGQGQTAYFGPVDRDILQSVFLEEGVDAEKGDSGGIADLVTSQTTSSMEDSAISRFKTSPTNLNLTKELNTIKANAVSLNDRESVLKQFLPAEKYSLTS